MKKSTRALALLLSLLMLLAALAGCAKQGETPAADTPAADTPASDTPAADTPAADTEKNSEHLTITVGYWDVDAALANRENDTVLKTIEEKFNVTFEPVNVTWDDYNQKFQLWASSDSLPDIFASDVRTTATFAEWANDGRCMRSRLICPHIRILPSIWTALSLTPAWSATRCTAFSVRPM